MDTAADDQILLLGVLCTRKSLFIYNFYNVLLYYTYRPRYSSFFHLTFIDSRGLIDCLN